MKPRDDKEVAGWLALAEEDIRIARLALEQEPPILGPACFHAQQAAEKGLKSLLVALNLTVPHTHDVVALLRLVTGLLPDAVEIREAAAVVTAYGVAPRYPSLRLAASEEEARRAVTLAEAVVAWVLARWP
jgi:HEPN domain-containing protein